MARHARYCLFLSLFLAGLWAGPAQAAEPDGDRPLYAPQSDWRLSPAGAGCTLSRDFARGEEKVRLTLQRMHPGAPIQFGLFGATIKRERSTIEAGFLPAQAMGGFDRVVSAAIGGAEGLVFVGDAFPELGLDLEDGPPPATLKARYSALAERVERFRVRGASKQDFDLATGAMLGPLERLDACLVAELAELGLTEEVRAATVSAAFPKDMSAWAGEIMKRYPRDAARLGRRGMVTARLIVSEEGRATHCDVLDQLTAKMLRDAACNALIEHARFLPARDAQDRPLVGVYIARIDYRLQRALGDVDARGVRIGN